MYCWCAHKEKCRYSAAPSMIYMKGLTVRREYTMRWNGFHNSKRGKDLCTQTAGGWEHRVHILVEMKQGQCICPLSWSVHCNFTGKGKCNEACTPHPHQPGLILPSSLKVRQKAAVATLCALWLGTTIVSEIPFPVLQNNFVHCCINKPDTSYVLHALPSFC
jgi:hypothetical protein